MKTMNVKRIFVVLIFCLTAAFAAQAQTYNSALGVRVGGTNAITFKHFYRNQLAWEGQLGIFGNGSSVTGLVMQHGNAFNTSGLRYYAGGGAHVAFYNGQRYSYWQGRDIYYYDSNSVALGINGILGLEYVLRDAPLGFSIDLKPFVEFGPGGNVGFSPDPSIGIKYIFR
jgi:hypothetical protein